MNVVASKQRCVSHNDSFAIGEQQRAPGDRDVFSDAVEDHDRVVDRVAEHGQESPPPSTSRPVTEYTPIVITTSVDQRHDHRHGERDLKRTAVDVITSREKSTAMIAERATVCSKLDDTFLTPGARAFTFV